MKTHLLNWKILINLHLLSVCFSLILKFHLLGNLVCLLQLIFIIQREHLRDITRDFMVMMRPSIWGIILAISWICFLLSVAFTVLSCRCFVLHVHYVFNSISKLVWTPNISLIFIRKLSLFIVKLIWYWREILSFYSIECLQALINSISKSSSFLWPLYLLNSGLILIGLYNTVWIANNFASSRSSYWSGSKYSAHKSSRGLTKVLDFTDVTKIKRRERMIRIMLVRVVWCNWPSNKNTIRVSCLIINGEKTLMGRAI